MELSAKRRINYLFQMCVWWGGGREGGDMQFIFGGESEVSVWLVNYIHRQAALYTDTGISEGLCCPTGKMEGGPGS